MRENASHRYGEDTQQSLAYNICSRQIDSHCRQESASAIRLPYFRLLFFLFQKLHQVLIHLSRTSGHGVLATAGVENMFTDEDNTKAPKSKYLMATNVKTRE